MEPENPTSRLRQTNEAQQAPTTQTGSQPAALEFASAEELIRHDAGQTEVPTHLETRLKASVNAEPPAAWWKRLFRR